MKRNFQCYFRGALYWFFSYTEFHEEAPHRDRGTYSGAALINFFVANAAHIRGRHLFRGGAYSSKDGKSHKNMTLVWDKTCNAYDHSHI